MGSGDGAVAACDLRLRHIHLQQSRRACIPGRRVPASEERLVRWFDKFLMRFTCLLYFIYHFCGILCLFVSYCTYRHASARNSKEKQLV